MTRARAWYVIALSLALAFLLPAAAARAGKRERGKKRKKPPAKAVPARSPKHNLDFWYYVPASAKGKRKVPLVLSYHGANGNGGGEIRMWQALAEKHGFIVACPTSRLAGAGQKAGVARRVNPQEYFTEAEAALSIVEMLTKKFKLDRRFVMVTGFSGGGNPSYWLGFIHPEVFPFLCTRCGNFPSLLPGLANAMPQLGAQVREAARNSYIYVFYGENDHPILLREIPNTIRVLQSLKAAHLKIQKVPGMKHQSRPEMAADWFMRTVATRRVELAAAAKRQHREALAAAAAALKEKQPAVAYPQYLAAQAREREYPELGRQGAGGVRRIERQAKTLLRTAKAKEKQRHLQDAADTLVKLTTRYRGTPSAKKGERLLSELRQRLAAAAEKAAAEKAAAEKAAEETPGKKRESREEK